MSEKVALVTGASRGIGRACAKVLAENGFRIAIHYRRDEEKAKELAASLPEAKIFQADLSLEEDCKQLIKSVKDAMGRIDVLVNNAGVSIDQIITFAKPEELEQVFNTNFKSVFHLSKAASRVMIKQKAGNIINLTSVVGHTGNGGQSMYAASKGAVTAFTKSIATDLANFGIVANCVAPGFIDTEMTSSLPGEVKEQIANKIPMKRLGTSDEVAGVVAFLASDAASYITGSTIHVNGGMFMA
ncbi:MAG: 3-oxoacyl-ACP reductase family protein [Oligoflexus sp.]